MLKINDQYILLGSTVHASWNLEPNLRFLFLWYPVSWMPWKNYRSIDNIGEISLHVTQKKVEVKIKQLHFLGFKTILSIKRSVHFVDVKNIDSKLSLIEGVRPTSISENHVEIASLFFNMKNRSVNSKNQNLNPTINTPSIKNILPI